MDDALSGLLHDVRPVGALFDRSVLRPQWSLRIVEAAPLTLLTMLSGTAWLRPDDADPVRLGAHDVAVLVGPEPYEIADQLDTAPGRHSRHHRPAGRLRQRLRAVRASIRPAAVPPARPGTVQPCPVPPP